MKIITKVALLVLMLGATACAKTDRFDNPGAGGAGGAGNIIPGSASDPTSSAYFQENVGDRILFEVDQSTLNEEARRAIRAQATWLIDNPSFSIIIEGHADEQGTREYNLALGARRASAVKEFLVELNVATSRLRTVSYGKERPIEICSDEACYSQNRRAVTVLSVGALTS